MKKLYLLCIFFVCAMQHAKSQCLPADGGQIVPFTAVYCGTPITLTVSGGNLRSNTHWAWYSDSCGGTLIGTGNSITVSPSTQTTYYIRGEGGGCVSACRPGTATIESPGFGSITQTSAGVERCGLGTVNLTAKADVGTINWYRTATETIVRGTGENFTAGSLNFGTNTYYVEVNNGGCVTSPRTAISFEAKDLPSWTSFGANATCPGGTSNITLVPDANSSFGGWYDAPSGGNLVSSTPSFTTPVLNVPTTFYGTLTHANGCTMDITRTPNVRPVPTLVSTTAGERCGPGSVNLSAVYNVTGTTLAEYQWYDAPTGGNFLSVQQNFATPSISGTTTFYVGALTIQGCHSATREPVTATIKSLPTITSTTPASKCDDGSLTLSATTSVGSLEWFNAETGGAQVGNGTSYTTPVLSQSTPYFVQSTFNGCTSGRTSVMAIINPVPMISVFSNQACDVGPVVVGALSNGTLSWFADQTGGMPLGTGESYTTPAITSTTVYYVDATLNGCSVATREPVMAIIRNTPYIETTTADERCGPGALTVSATSSPGSFTIWYDSETAGNQLTTAPSLPVDIVTTTTYYVSAFYNDCESARTPVVATIKPFPTLTTTDATRCDAGTVTLSGSSDGTISWFTAATGGNSIGTGTSFITPSISTTTNYFAESVLNGCTSLTRVQATATVNNTPAQPIITQNNANIEAPVLTSSATSGNQWYKNDVAITGATNTTYTITDAGVYKVKVNNSGCISPFSAAVNYVITGFEVADEKMLKLYPNPTADELVINLNGFDVDKLVNVAVVDLMGRTLNQSTALGGEEISFKVSQYNAGHYLVLASQGNRKIVRSFIKSR